MMARHFGCNLPSLNQPNGVSGHEIEKTCLAPDGTRWRKTTKHSSPIDATTKKNKKNESKSPLVSEKTLFSNYPYQGKGHHATTKKTKNIKSPFRCLRNKCRVHWVCQNPRAPGPPDFNVGMCRCLSVPGCEINVAFCAGLPARTLQH